MELTSTLLTNRQIDERLISLEQEVNQQQSRSGKQANARLGAKINELEDAITILESRLDSQETTQEARRQTQRATTLEVRVDTLESDSQQKATALEKRLDLLEAKNKEQEQEIKRLQQTTPPVREPPSKQRLPFVTPDRKPNPARSQHRERDVQSNIQKRTALQCQK